MRNTFSDPSSSSLIQVASVNLSLLYALLSFAFCGCGGSSEEVSPSPGSSVPPPPVVTPTQAPARQVARKKQLSPEKESPATSGVIVTSQHFEIAKPPRFDVMPPAKAPREYFAVVSPVVDSTLVEVEPPEKESPPQPTIGLKLPAGFEVSSGASFNNQGYPRKIRCQGDGSVMVLIEEGVSIRGSKEGPPDVQPEHRVFVSSFYIDQKEVTLAQFDQFRNEFNESAADNAQALEPVNVSMGADAPALGIAWRDADSYAKHYGKELPSEAEWEYAARGKQSHAYPWGFGRPLVDGSTLTEIAPVGARSMDVTPTGLFDMAGNAAEWTSDWYSATTYEKQAETTGLLRNPQGPRRSDRAGRKVTRGSQGTWKLWLRDQANVRTSGENIGFRCLLRITEEMLVETN